MNTFVATTKAVTYARKLFNRRLITEELIPRCQDAYKAGYIRALYDDGIATSQQNSEANELFKMACMAAGCDPVEITRKLGTGELARGSASTNRAIVSLLLRTHVNDKSLSFPQIAKVSHARSHATVHAAVTALRIRADRDPELMKRLGLMTATYIELVKKKAGAGSG